MHRSIRRALLVASLLVVALVSCGGDDKDASEDSDDAAFCDAMRDVAERMAPDDGPTPPAVVEREFGEVVDLLAAAISSAPDAIADDVAAYANAIDEYVGALDEAGYDLDVIFSTPEGTQLAIDSSHALTPAVIEYMVGPCGIELE